MPELPTSSQRFREQLYRRVSWSDLDPEALSALVARARDEDLDGAGFREGPARPGDASTAAVIGEAHGSADLIAREKLVACGLPLVPLVLEAYGNEAHFSQDVEEGQKVAPGGVLGRLEGTVAPLLTAERVILNFLQRLSGIATATARFCEALGPDGPCLLDTRKTTPGLRALEKYATATGGGWNHRLGLYDRIMLKDNHLAASKGSAGERLAAAVRQAISRRPDLPVEVEVDLPEQILPALHAGAHVILLDNFSDTALAAAVREIDGRALTEASGGINLDRCARLRDLGLDFVSTGATVHQARWVDIGLDWRS